MPAKLKYRPDRNNSIYPAPGQTVRLSDTYLDYLGNNKKLKATVASAAAERFLVTRIEPAYRLVYVRPVGKADAEEKMFDLRCLTPQEQEQEAA